MSNTSSRVFGGSSSGRLFREFFTFGSASLTHWFPSHMARSLNKMQAQMKKVDCVIEVHDARIPFTGKNDMLRSALSVKPHLLILNKKDLADSHRTKEVKDRLLETEGIKHIMYTNCLKQNSYAVNKVIPHVLHILEDEMRFNRNEAYEYNIMVTGIPNVGKSSLINAMRRHNIKKGKAARVGKLPGVTRSVMNRILVSTNPPVWLLDTPGILTPYVQDIETGMKLAMCGVLKDNMVGDEVIADYLLYTFNKLHNYRYCQEFHLDDPCDEIFELLAHIAKRHKKTHIVRGFDGSRTVRWNINAGAVIFLRAFREGNLGPMTLV